MKCIIIDDDAFFRTTLTGFIRKAPSLELIRAFDSALDALQFLETHTPDLIFLDVEMPELSGLEFLKSLIHQPAIIMVSSNRDYAVNAFDHEVVDFIQKPLESYSRFSKAVMKVRLINTSNSLDRTDSIFFKDGKNIIRLSLTELDFAHAYGDYVKIITNNKSFTVYNTLKSFKQSLPSISFIQVHRSYIVQLNKIDRIVGNTIFIGKHEIIISNSHKSELLERMNLLDGSRNVLP